MKQIAPVRKGIDANDSTAFTVWLGRTLRTHLEHTMNEPIPLELLELLPPASKDR